MRKQCLAALFAACPLSIAAQPVSLPSPVQPSVDTAEERQALRTFTVCLAKSRPNWARETLAYPYLSSAQARAAADALMGRDNCLGVAEKALTFRTSTLVAALAEYFVRSELTEKDPKRLGAALAAATPLNASEDFGLCVASTDVNAAVELTLSEPGSPTETRAASELGARVRTCENAGENLKIDLQSLRALVSAAIYRATTTGAATPRI